MSLRHLGVLAFDKTLQWDRWYENLWKPAQLCIQVDRQDVKFLGNIFVVPLQVFFFICIVGFLVETKTDLRYSHLSFTKAGPHHLNFHKQWKSSTSLVLKTWYCRIGFIFQRSFGGWGLKNLSQTHHRVEPAYNEGGCSDHGLAFTKIDERW